MPKFEKDSDIANQKDDQKTQEIQEAQEKKNQEKIDDDKTSNSDKCWDWSKHYNPNGGLGY